MSEDGSELSISTKRGRDGHILVPCICRVEVAYGVELVLHTGRPLSYLSQRVYDVLHALDTADEIGGFYRVRNFHMGGQRVPDLIARVSMGPALLGFDGFLGLQFLEQFRLVCRARDTGILTLRF